ncbi:MAG: 6-bladed beta-propeller, partial [Tannerellaceae bacterium]|nr:6-bladed beta-propeller [Tannerellaceae bacterium]
MIVVVAIAMVVIHNIKNMVGGDTIVIPDGAAFHKGGALSLLYYNLKNNYMLMNSFWSILLAFAVCSCTVSTETEKYQRKRNNIIDVRDKITAIKIEDPIISSTNRLYLIEDYLLIQDFKALDKLIHLFDKNDFRYITSVGYRGQGPDELTSMGFITVDVAHRSFYVNDYGKQKIVAYHLDSVLSNPSCLPEVRIEMNETIFPSGYQMINDSIAICRIIQPIGTNNFK